MIKYRIKEITYGDGSKKFKVQCQQRFLLSIKGLGFYGCEQLFALIFLSILTLGTVLIVTILIVLYFYIFPEWENMEEEDSENSEIKHLIIFDDLYEAQLYVEQEQERDKEAFEQEQKAKELKKAQKIVSERIVKLRERAFELPDYKL